ncbi:MULTISPECIES: hypothetical protein [Bacillus cereus group]|uniref:Uncharacterized protein n=2 Tax=Bacillus cytotoxicus TaxID=580165 RepID=A0AAX2CJS5_9BACI|nr:MULTISPECIES: hypothetical protein [Bacillus cereus group]ABS22835.1 hypothetical protein Bcer98_2601 [Bacillus cytotoxicus NVH 391-98]AWC29492.1 hypothetical protein CG483_014915 [Bacillus cytotoxicus]AWC33504.1 hypothetical protein CG482_014670 [Bacillus cytotoxicus]AWC37482.1 hypothetical protein CG481_014445 [Bacillus cytotoxicus]AWC41623.1 hypothetical protein CG480_014915 [Bacillus cytotoxicus]
MDGFKKMVNDMQNEQVGSAMMDFALAAKMMFAAFTQFKEAGFSEEQSFELTREILIDSLNRNQ